MVAIRSVRGASAAAVDRAFRALLPRSPDTQMLVGAVLHVDGGPPELSELRDHIAARLPVLPALTSYLAPGATRWTVSCYPDLAVHVAERAAPGEQENLESVVAELTRTELPDDAPHWRLWLLHGRTPRQYALLYLAHHYLQDAGGMLHTLESLFGPEIPAEASSAVYHGYTRHRPTAADYGRSLMMSVRNVRQARKWNVPHCRTTPDRTLHWSRVPTDALGSIAATFDGTRNDVYIAAIAHSLAHWLDTMSDIPARRDLAFAVPANIRRPEEVDLPGNRTALTHIRLPATSLDPAQRIAGTIRATMPLKSPCVRTALRAGVDHVPMWLARATVNTIAGRRRGPVGASHIALRHRLAFRGSPVTAVYPVMCAPAGTPLAVLSFTYEGYATVCFRADKGFPGLDRIHHTWQDTIRTWNASPLRS
ncbi:wax ester/triacylglycerol synthase family O-acyltransferase [Nocardia sp. NBC_00881]|uniref:wax ester/triacylglycerol synthase domain-containing protein n=1 Tax=Nocardia sp. NBC_00881 TaxID=2975995 RepID=UPI003869A744|nr:wax ester/triacylglycerol synthase family O-acyltransferase [Nocardia sp. NBC_00881]